MSATKAIKYRELSRDETVRMGDVYRCTWDNRKVHEAIEWTLIMRGQTTVEHLMRRFSYLNDLVVLRPITRLKIG